MFDHYESIVTVNGEQVKLEFWDVSATKKHRDLVKYAIGKSSFFMICFNVIDFKTFKSVSETWI